MKKKFESTKEFIEMYNSAYQCGMTFEHLAWVLGVKPKTVERKRIKIKHETGTDLPYLPTLTENLRVSDPVKPEDDLLKLFSSRLEDLRSKDEKFSVKSHKNIKRNKKTAIYVITSAQNATPIHEGFFRSIENYCNERNAELLVIPYRYRNPTSIWNVNNDEHEWWHSKVIPHLVEDHIRLNDNIRVMGHISITPTAVHPLSGLDSITKSDSAIFGHPSVELKAVPTPASKIPKILSTTGSLTVPNYTDSKSGHRGKFNHSLSACIVEISGDKFFIRNIHGDENTGHFYDLDKLYTTTSIKKNQRASALISGDIHAEFHCPEVESATYTDKESVMNVTKPKNWVIHDLEDFYPRNHHHVNNDLISFSKHHFGRDNVEEGLQKSADFVDKHSRKGMKNIVVKSNHDEALDRWLIEGNPKQDPENAVLFHYLKYHQYKSVRPTDVGFESFDPLEFWCNNPESLSGLKNKDNTLFLKRDQPYQIEDIEVGFHGDRGPNGSRGSILSFSKIGPKVVIGHSHSPGIFQGVYQVGISARTNLSYVSGPSSWLHTHCLIYPDGSRTLIHVIEGEWKV